MTRLPLILISALTCLPTNFTLADDKGQSVMFSPEEPAIDLAPADKGVSSGDKCEALLQEAEALKGKPQRKHTVLERYRLECSQTKHP